MAEGRQVINQHTVVLVMTTNVFYLCKWRYLTGKEASRALWLRFIGRTRSKT